MPLDNLTTNAARYTDEYVLPFDRLYLGTTAARRAIIPAHQLARIDVALALLGDTSTQDLFPSANNAITLDATAHYRFRIVAALTTGATSAAVNLILGGTATLTSIFYVSQGTNGAAGTAVAPVMNSSVVATTTVVVAAGTGVTKRFMVEGELETLAAGTFIPQIVFSADPQGDETVNVGSFMEVWKISDTAGLTFVGNYG